MFFAKLAIKNSGDAQRQQQRGYTHALLRFLNASLGLLAGVVACRIMIIEKFKVGFSYYLKNALEICSMLKRQWWEGKMEFSY